MSREKNIFSSIVFSPATIRNLSEGSDLVQGISLGGDENSQAEGFNSLTGTFRYDMPGSQIKSTQQLNVDFSKFENHTFFNSAESKVQVAFEKIVNHYPFDGSKKENIRYTDALSGYQKWVLDSFPKNVGFLLFSGTQKNETPASGSAALLGTYISVKDYEGTSMASAGMKGKGEHVLNIFHNPFTVEFHLYVPSGSTNDNQVIVQKKDANNHGFTMALSCSNFLTSPLGKVELKSILSSGSNAASSSVTLTKGKFYHIASMYDKYNAESVLTYVNGTLAASSSNLIISTLEGNTDPLVIGSGSAHPLPWENFAPKTTLSGAVDELRIFSEKRTRKQLRAFSNRSMFSENKLRLYFRFNEPSGSFGPSNESVNKSLVLDYSGNGLHTRVSNFSMSLRTTGSHPIALKSERKEMSPILFPSYESVSSLGQEFLAEANSYDYNNPNLITKMIPKHYLYEASEAEGFGSEFGNVGDNYQYTSDLPGGGKMQSSQIIASILFMWAEVFDEIKMFVDEFGRLLKVDYLTNRTISDHMLPFLAKYYGIVLPNPYSSANLKQFEDGENIKLNGMSSNLGLQSIQNTLWRRILTDLPETFRSRGTRHSIEALFRSMGIQPDSVFRIREYGGSKTRSISDAHEKRNEIAAMLDFSGSLNPIGTINGSGKDDSRPLIQTGFLSGSRIEPGRPDPAGTLSSIGSTNASDGLLTSGSWTVEGIFKLEPKIGSGQDQFQTQSLMRMQTTGTISGGTSNNWLLFNVLAHAPERSLNKTGSLKLFGRPVGGSSADAFSIKLEGANVFDGEKWTVSFGRIRNDMTSSYVSSSYFFRAGKVNSHRIVSYVEKSILYDDSGNNPMNTLNAETNASGAFIVVGSQSLSYDASSASGGFVNSLNSIEANYLKFSGKIAGLRFYSKALTKKETMTHIRSFKSIGVENPLVNFSFNTARTGSFERLRVDLSCDQPHTKSNSDGTFKLFDFSQNLLHASGTGFQASTEIIKPERFDYLILSPKFGLSSDPNKVRIRSFTQIDNVQTYGTKFSPLYEIPEDEVPVDDQRVAVEVSSAQALNEDIVNIFATLDVLDNILGGPENLFSQEYKDLRNLREIYFNRLTDKVSLTKFFQFFKWFDNTVGELIAELVPSNVNYLGANFVIESHMLERAKMTYKFHDMYVGVNDRRSSSVLFMQQYLGLLRKR